MQNIRNKECNKVAAGEQCMIECYNDSYGGSEYLSWKPVLLYSPPNLQLNFWGGPATKLLWCNELVRSIRSHFWIPLANTFSAVESCLYMHGIQSFSTWNDFFYKKNLTKSQRLFAKIDFVQTLSRLYNKSWKSPGSSWSGICKRRFMAIA